MPQFTGGPSVTVTANNAIEFEWNTDVAWLGKVDIYDKIDATVPIFTAWATDTNGGRTQLQSQRCTVMVAATLAKDTQYYFQVTAIDPSDTTAFIAFPNASPWLPVFTGQQVLTSVATDSITQTSATVRWNSDVLGTGSVTLNGTNTQTDAQNTLAHAIQFNNLTAGTTYQFTANTVNQITGAVLASASGSFQTAIAAPPPSPTLFVFNEPAAQPRVIPATQSSTVSVRCWNDSNGTPVVGTAVTFAIASGTGSLSAGSGMSDVNGIATVVVIGGARGLVDVQVTSTSSTNSPFKIPVVVK